MSLFLTGFCYNHFMPVLAENRRARFDYDILEILEAGLKLTGSEVKAVRGGKASIAGAHVIIRGGEAYVVGMNIEPYQPLNKSSLMEKERTITLLLNKKEIEYLFGKTEKTGLTMIPLRVYTKGPRVKLEIGLARGKKKGDKRESIKKRDDERISARALIRE